MPQIVRCPDCNIRLFDLKSKQVDLIIKCPRCKKILEVARPPNENELIIKNSYRATETVRAP